MSDLIEVAGYKVFNIDYTNDGSKNLYARDYNFGIDGKDCIIADDTKHAFYFTISLKDLFYFYPIAHRNDNYYYYMVTGYVTSDEYQKILARKKFDSENMVLHKKSIQLIFVANQITIWNPVNPSVLFYESAKHYLGSLNRLPKDLQTFQFFEKIIKYISADCLEFIDPNIQNYDLLCKLCIHKDPQTIRHVYYGHPNYDELLYLSISQNLDALKNVKIGKL